MEYYKNSRRREKKNFTQQNTVKTRTPNRKKKNNAHSLSPGQFISKASSAHAEAYTSDRFIDDLPVDLAIIRNLQKKGYEKPTEIQDLSLIHISEPTRRTPIS